MPVSADRERQLLNKYKIPSLYPEKWPTRADDSSDDDDEAPASNGLSPIPYNSKLSVNSRSSYSKYRNIDRHASVRSATRDSESLVRNDEPDALGMAPSVASELKRRGLPIDENLKLRNRFMLSSTTFNPASFLATVHQNASTEDLLRGLDHLSQSIEQKSASLKVLVESNFEKFVKAKATIDNVYTEMRTQGVEAGASEQQKADNRLSLHTRQTSKNQSHFRSASGRIVSGSRKSVVIPEKKKNALTKESEYGVQGIKTPLLEIAIKAEEVWGPTLGGREKEESLREVLSTFDQHRDIFTLSGELAESIRKRDYDGIVYAHKQANRHANFARNMADIAKANGGQLSDEDAQVIIVTAKMWNDVDPQINACKIDALKRLRESHGRRPAAVPEETDKEEHMELIGLLLQLGVDDNPIWQWLNSRFLYLKDKIARSFERSRIELEIMRRKLANSSRTDVQGLAQYLRSVANPDSFRFAKESGRDLDSPPIITFWEKVHSSMTALLSLQSGIVGEVIEYWETTQSFIDNKAQKAFSSAVVAAGQEHLELEPDDVQNLRSGAVELVNLIRDNVLSFFSDPPVDDLSDLYSPIPPTPKSPDVSMALSPNLKKTFTFDIMNAPPPSPQRGDAWEKFAFWAPQSNCISGSLYLGRVLMIIGVGASELSALSVVKQTRGGESLKTLVGTVRERCIQAVCAAWTTDSDRCRILESWTRQSDRRDLTTVAPSIAAFEENVLQHAQKIAYITDAMSARGSAEVIVPPSAKMLQSLRGTFVSSLHKVFSGMVDNAEQGDVSGVGNVDPDGVTVPKSAAADDDRVTIAVDSNNRDIRMLLTLSNLSHLKAEIVPHLVSQFETNFSVKLSDETKTIRDVLGQLDTRLFQAYIKPTVDYLQQTIATGISTPSWEPAATARPTDAKPYIYAVLLKLVLIHSDVSSTTPTLTNQILSHLLEQASLFLIQAFKARCQPSPSSSAKYSLPALMQATLDVEFLAQTLNNYTTDKASETQSQIYLALDERTDNESRAKLQGELPAMRAILKKLREGTKGEFGCFKKERRGRSERAATGTGRGARAAPAAA